LTVILFIAYQARYKWLPLLSQAEDKKHEESTAHLKKWVSIEFFLALVLILIASILANTLPAKHAIIEDWPFPFRFSIDDATWEEPYAEEMIWTGAMLFVFALGMIWLSIKYNWNWKKKILVPGTLAITSLAIVLPPIAIEAYPETYLKPIIPLDAISISHGSHLFAEHCVSCHGPQGKGNGLLAETLSTTPTDLLTEPHTARHTVGNFFHWVSHGVPGTGMPGFSSSLSDEDLWDVVNFLHALSRGFDARLLGSMIIPETPAIAAPVFFYSANGVSGGDLKDFRLQKNVILVLFSWPQSQQRLNQLKHAYEKLSLSHNAEILAAPMRKLDQQELLDITDSVPFPVVTEGWSEIRDTYLLYRRVRAVPDLSGEGMTPDHMEFMIDRFGYLRARWVARFEGFGWQNVNALTFQLDQLNQEDEIMPSPDDHAH
jgi:copper resistance protein D